jgi:hypothetical protein
MYTYIKNQEKSEQSFHLRKQMTANMIFILQNMYLITVPITTILTTITMLMPYWWSSDTFQVGLWRAHSLSSSWINVEPEIDTEEGRNN